MKEVAIPRIKKKAKFELREFAERERIEIIREFTEAKSAKKPGREEFAKMFSMVETSKKPLGILVWHPDRLARNSVDGGKIIYLVDTGAIVSLRFPQFWFEPTPQGKFMLSRFFPRHCLKQCRKY